MMGQTQIKKTVGNRLKTAREAAGYSSPQAFCKKHHFPIIEYQQHENGERPIRASDAVYYCELLSVSLNWLLLGEEVAA